MKHKKYYGFTIVELLIVIVVIGVLAAISVAAYSGIQGKARDSQRLQDLASIQKALELYKVENGRYPPVVPTAEANGWEVSTSGTFLSRLVESGTVSAVPTDPRNSMGSGSAEHRRNGNNWIYFYAYYSAGARGADPACGAFYVLGASRFDGVPSNQSYPSSPGFSTPDRNWVSMGAYVTGHYTNC